MKRMLTYLLAAAFLLLCACAAPAEDGGSVTVYYPVTDGLESGIAIQSVVFPLPEGSDPLTEALLQLTDVPPSPENIENAFPNGIHLASCELEGTELRLELEGDYRKLSPVRKSLFKACLVLSLCGLNGIENISLYKDGTCLEENLNRSFLLAESVLDDEVTVVVTVWLPEIGRECLTSVNRVIRTDEYESWAEAAVQMVLSEMEVPAGTAKNDLLIRAEQDDSECVLDFHEDFYRFLPEALAEERLFLFALVDTLTESEDISSVRFLSEGRVPQETGSISLLEPLRRETGFCDSEMDEIDCYTANAFVQTADGRIESVLVAFPISNSLFEPSAQIMDFMLHTDNTWGYLLPFPEGTELVSLTVGDDGIADVLLTDEFCRGSEEACLLAADLLARAAVSTGTVDGVRFRTELEGDYLRGRIFGGMPGGGDQND